MLAEVDADFILNLGQHCLETPALRVGNGKAHLKPGNPQSSDCPGERITLQGKIFEPNEV